LKQIEENNDFLSDQMLPGDEIMDIVEYAVPWHWQYTMQLYGFKTVMNMDSEFVEFCKCMEFTELPTEPLAKLKSTKNGKGPTAFGRSPTFKNQDRKQKLDYWDHYCVLHQTKSHDTSKCKVVLDQAK